MKRKPFETVGLDRRNFLALAAVSGVAVAAPSRSQANQTAAHASGSGLEIATFASDPKELESVSTHLVHAPDGIVVVDTQRLLPNAQYVVEMIKRTGRPVIGVFITHAHSDHYGGLPTFRSFAPDAPVFATETTIRTIRDDGFGFNAARRERHGDLFATQEALNAALPNRIVRHGETLTLGGMGFEVFELTAGESDSTAVYHAPDHARVFPGDLVQNMKIPMPFLSHATWLAQLETMATRLPSGTISYQGHGAPSDFHELATATAEYLSAARDLVRERLDEAESLSADATAEIVRALTERFPFHIAGGGNTRAQVLTGLTRRLANQLHNGDTAYNVFAS